MNNENNLRIKKTKLKGKKTKGMSVSLMLTHVLHDTNHFFNYILYLFNYEITSKPTL
jgi:hypothetical protein